MQAEEPSPFNSGDVYRQTRRLSTSRKFKSKRGTLPALGLKPDRTAVRKRDVLHDCQPETGSAGLTGTCLVNTIETLKKARTITFIDPRTLISHGDAYRSPLGIDGQGNDPAGCTIL